MDKSCRKCGDKLFCHDSATLEDNDECIEIECIAEARHVDEKWYFCSDCNIFQLECPSCGNDCYVYKYPLYDPINRNKIENIYCRPKFFLDCSKWCATGPDGGMDHCWGCSNCDFDKSFTDK